MCTSQFILRAALVGAFCVFCTAGEPSKCTCAQARLQHGWCEACGVGYVASFPVKSRKLYEAIHPHGHIVDKAVVQCTGCQQAIFSDGWCRSCQAGYVGGQAYFSKLTYLLAFGTIVDPATLKCEACKRATQHAGWCGKCNIGWVGNVRFDKREHFDAAAHELETFFTAVKKCADCELCAEAMVMSSRCPICRITYADGKPVEPAKP